MIEVMINGFSTGVGLGILVFILVNVLEYFFGSKEES